MARLEARSGATGSDRDGGAKAAGQAGAARPPSPWSVRGVSREARAKAAKAATRRRETLGEWVTNALVRMANEELGSGPRAATERPAGKSAGLSGLPARHDPTAHGPATPDKEGNLALGKAVLALAGRLDKTEQRDRALAELIPRLENSEKRDQALSEISRRLDDAERRDRALTKLSRQLEDTGKRDNAITDIAVRMAGLEQRGEALTTLAGRLDTSMKREQAMLSVMQNLVERSQRSEDRINDVATALSELAARLERDFTQSQSEAARQVTQSLMPLERVLGSLSDKLMPQSTAPAALPATPPAAPVRPEPPYSTAHTAEPPPRPAPQTPQAAPQPATYEPTPYEPTSYETPPPPPAAKPERPKLKFDFEALNRHAIENTQRMAAESTAEPGRRGLFARKREPHKTEPHAHLPELDDETPAAEARRHEPEDSGDSFEQILGAAEQVDAAKRPRRWFSRKRQAEPPTEGATDDI